MKIKLHNNWNLHNNNYFKLKIIFFFFLPYELYCSIILFAIIWSYLYIDNNIIYTFKLKFNDSLLFNHKHMMYCYSHHIIMTLMMCLCHISIYFCNNILRLQDKSAYVSSFLLSWYPVSITLKIYYFHFPYFFIHIYL